MPKKTNSVKISDLEKPWNKKSGLSSYDLNKKKKNKRFLILCAGQTEREYFRSFKVVSAEVVLNNLGGISCSDLVKKISAHTKGNKFDEVWCVFDFDRDPKKKNQINEFNSAIEQAKSKKYRCAYSNDCFELWFILHYEYHDREELRDYYYKLLSNKWAIDYEKNGKKKKFASEIYKMLERIPNSQEKAIKNAKKLFELKKDKNYHQQNPVTTVYQLVESLNKYLRK